MVRRSVLAERVGVGDYPGGVIEQSEERREAVLAEEAVFGLGDDDDVSVFGWIGVSGAPDRLHAVVRQARRAGERIRDVRVLARQAHAAERAEAVERRDVLGAGGGNDAAGADAEVSEEDERLLWESALYLLHPGEAGDAQVVVAQRDLDGDVLLAEDAHAHVFAATRRQAVLARAFAVAFDVQAGARQGVRDGNTQVARGQRDLDHASLRRPSARLRRPRQRAAAYYR